jgi:hypothetical protein
MTIVECPKIYFMPKGLALIGIVPTYARLLKEFPALEYLSKLDL